MKNVITKKFIFEVFNMDKYICSVIASNMIDAIKQAKRKVNDSVKVIDTGHCIN